VPLLLLLLTLFVSSIVVIAHALSRAAHRRRAGLRPLFTWGDPARLSVIATLGWYLLGLLGLNWRSEYDYCRLQRTGDQTGISGHVGAELESYERMFLPLRSECTWSDGMVQNAVPGTFNLVLLVLVIGSFLLCCMAADRPGRVYPIHENRP
jgi:hypothetical protein